MTTATSSNAATPSHEHPDLSVSLADAALHAALGVGDYLRQAFRQKNDVDFKADFHDPVTIHDKNAQSSIVDTLFRFFPDSLIIAEESALPLTRTGEPQEASESDITWYVDPIDGTSNFAAGFDHWCVSIAAARAGKLLCGVIYQPTQDIAYRGDSRGSYKIFTASTPRGNSEAAAPGTSTARAFFPEESERLSASTAPAARGIIATEFPSARITDADSAMRGFLSVLHGSRSLRRPGSTALALAEVACGHFLATFNVGTHPWDVAAGAFLVEKAGGHYIGWDADARVYSHDAHTAKNFVATASRDAAQLCLNASGHSDTQGALEEVFDA